MLHLPIIDALPKGGSTPLLTKVFTPEGRRDYDDAFWFGHDALEFETIEHLSVILDSIQSWSSSCVIRGELIEGRINPVLRRKDAWGGHPAYFREATAGVGWFMADIDKVPAPPGLHSDDRIPFLISLLPDYLHDVSFHFQWSASAGVRGWDLLSCHLWYVVEEPRTDSSMGRWAEETGVIDPAVMRTVQPHYTAQPIFQGVYDPLGSERSGFVRRGRGTAPIPFAPEPPAAAIAWSSEFRPIHRGRFTAFEERIQQIGPRLHLPVQKAIASYVACGGTDWDYLKNRVRTRIWECPKDGQDPSGYTNDRYLDASIRGAVRKFGGRR